MNNNINNYLIPNVSRLPQHKKVRQQESAKNNVNIDEFKNILKEKSSSTNKSEMHGIKLSVHAKKRVEERRLSMDSNEFLKLRNAIDKLRDKGGRDSLVITNKAAYIVDVGKDTVVTAIDKGAMNDNVFTKIDSTLMVN